MKLIDRMSPQFVVFLLVVATLGFAGYIGWVLWHATQ